jgi:asparagine synthase (glutamine-hydrolysing)
MCGIAGLIRFDGGPVETELEAMSKLIAHRGPDQSSTWTFESERHTIGLAHRRLSIRDLSDSGRQPLPSRSGHSILVYNGEIYNEADLIEELRVTSGFRQRSSCDSEVLIEALEQFGPSCVRRLNGIFAFASYNCRTGETLLARDPVGVKPLYLWRPSAGAAIAFSSEVKAFLALKEFKRSIDIASLSALLTHGYVGPDRSLMQDVVSVAPGDVLHISGQGVVTRQANIAPRWFPRSSYTADPASLRSEFEAAVTRQRVSDVPLAVWQSGGIDSTLVNAACSVPRPRSVIFASDVKDFDESEEGQLIAKHLGSDVNLATFKSEEQPEDTFASVVWHLDGELADSSALAVKRLSAATRPFATVVLSGDGADELFGGYSTYGATRLASRFGTYVPKSISHRMSRILLDRNGASQARYPAFEFAGRFLQGMPFGHHAHAEWRRYGMPWVLDEIASSEVKDALNSGADPYHAAINNAQARYPDVDPTSWGQAADLSYYLPGDMLMKVDRMSMAHGLEVRVPFLDLQFIDYVSALDPDLRLPIGGVTKRLLREMASSFGLPSSITQRKKTGFNVPLAHRLRTDYRSVMKSLLLDEDYVSPYLRPDAVRRLVADHLDEKTNHAYILWTLMTFAQWRLHLEKTA